MASVQFFTIASSNYLPQISLLKASLDATHPEISFTIFLCDELPKTVPVALVGADIVPISETGFPHYEAMAHRYSILELNTAVKPFIFAYLFERHLADFAVYLDPDLIAVTRFHELFELFAQKTNIILTPHTMTPIEDVMRPNDKDMAQAGIYNLGFCAVAATHEGRRFIGWWCRKLLYDCRVDIANGIFVDQKWCDALPALFEGVHVLRHEGYNVGYWNLMHRPLSISPDGVMMAGMDEARLLHFSGLNMLDYGCVSKHQDRLNTGNLNEVTREAFTAYRYHLLANNFFRYSRLTPSLPGERLFKSSEHNAIYVRTLSGLLEQVGHGSRLPSPADLQSFIIAQELTPKPAYELPDLLYVLRAMRTDLKKAFKDLESASGIASYLDWLISEGVDQTTLIDPETVTRHVTRHRQTLAVLTGKPLAKGPPKFVNELAEFNGTVDQHLIFATLACLEGEFLTGIEAIDEPAPVPAFLRFIYEARFDLSDLFDLSTVGGRLGLLDWAARCFENEYGRQRSLAKFFNAVRAGPSTWADGWVNREGPQKTQICASALDHSTWSRSINFGFQPTSTYALFDRGSEGPRTELASASASLISLPPLSDRITLIGYPHAEMGMGEHVRNTALALDDAKIPYEILNFDTDLLCGLGHKALERRIVTVPSGKINIFNINADQTILAHEMLGDGLFKGRYNIGYWAWELERFPDAWRKAIELVDEIWAPSTFIQGALRQVTDKPVIHMPLRVERLPAATVDLQRLAVPLHGFSYLFFFDFNSFQSRKNPMGVVSAFREAFPRGDGSDVTLIIKTIGAEQHPRAAAKLRSLVEKDARIVLIEETLQSAEMAGLIESCDCFVSLHRSEGFGRGIAEAMAAGRSVIATGYGGNMDFMNEQTAYVVDYQLVPVGSTAYVHGAGAYWAEPDVSHAAQLMRHVFSHRDEAAERALAGQSLIEARHSTAAVGKDLRRRIAAIGIIEEGGGAGSDNLDSPLRLQAGQC